jgi:hypothetical protein
MAKGRSLSRSSAALPRVLAIRSTLDGHASAAIHFPASVGFPILEASLSLAEEHEARLELARLLEQTERSSEALPHYRAAAEQPA